MSAWPLHVPCGRRSCRTDYPALPSRWCSGCLISALLEKDARAPIALNGDIEAAAREWAADDRLWTTQEIVAFNLRTFARVVLKAKETTK